MESVITYDNTNCFDNEYLQWWLRETEEGQAYLHRSEMYRELERKFTPTKRGKRSKRK